jgi:AcrR family transcriptional regulator
MSRANKSDESEQASIAGGDERSSAGDLERVLRLLWRNALSPGTNARRGPPRALSVDAIVDTAIKLCDDEGLSALSMRNLADRLRVKPMTIYTYVPGRAELIDLMIDQLYCTLPQPEFDVTLQWRQRVHQMADRNRQLYLQHPWAAAVSTTRPPLGPGQMEKYEYELRAFTGSGLDDLQTDDALTLLLTFVRANARDAEAAKTAKTTSGTNDQEWWEYAQPLFAEVFDEDRYPLAARIGSGAGTHRGSAHDPQHAYTFGLSRILASFEQLAAGNSSTVKTRRRGAAQP